MVYITAIIALLIFIYFNRYLQRKRDERRAHWRERREDQLQQFFEAKKKPHTEPNNETPT